MSNDQRETSPETGYVRSTYKNGQWTPPVPIFPANSFTPSVSSSQPQVPEPSTGSSMYILEQKEDYEVLSPSSADGWGITLHQPTWSQCEELEKSVLNTAPSPTLVLDSTSPMEQSLFQSEEEMNCVSSSEMVEPFSTWPPTPLGMTCCCDSPATDFGSCPIYCTPGSEIPLSHLFVKSIMEPRELESPEGSFQLFQRHISNHRESGGIITLDNPSSSWMILMGLSYNLVISSGLLTATLRGSKLKEVSSPYLPRTSVSPPMCIHPIGGLSPQLMEMAETLFGAALLEYTATRLKCQNLKSVARKLFEPDLC